MKKTKLFIVLLVAVSLFSIAASVEKRIGEQIIINEANTGMTFPANTPFHVAHGWDYPTTMGTATLNDGAAGLNLFTLKIDGVEQHFSFLEQTVLHKLEYGGVLWHYFLTIWVFNFPDGMEGTHTFTGQWWGICGEWFGNTCEKPNKLVVVGEKAMTVHFDAP